MVTCFMLSTCFNYAQQPGKPIWQSKEYAVFGDKITQGDKYVAKAVSSKELTSNYQSPANLFQRPVITFKFSINGKDNEMKSGIDHQFVCLGKDGAYETPAIQFGEQFRDTKQVVENSSLTPGTYLLVAGSTNHMQSQISNDEVIVEYTDGSQTSLDLRNPETWCPIEKDYYVDGYAFSLTKPRPVRLALKTGVFFPDFSKVLSAKDFGGKNIDGGAATVLDLPLDASKQLKSLKVRTLANEVVIGLMGISLLR